MLVIGIDLGGTKIVSALFDREGNIRCRAFHLLEKRKGKEVGLLVLQTIDELMEMSGTTIDNIEALGICVPGIANSKTGLVWAPNIEGWENYPLQKEIEEYIDNSRIKISIASDRTCYILGEAWKGAAKGVKNAVFIAVGTGIGMGLLIDGKIVHGHGDVVGAAGWFALETPYFDEYERYGCLESYASGDGIARQTRKLLKERLLFKESILYNIKELDQITTKDVFEAYSRGDSLAKFIIGKAIILWSMAAANIVSLLNPEIIVWGGGVFGPASQLLDRIYDEACRWAQPIAIKQVSFRKSLLRGDAGLYGAGHLALLSLNDKTNV